jgi:hypothetical protein
MAAMEPRACGQVLSELLRLLLIKTQKESHDDGP